MLRRCLPIVAWLFFLVSSVGISQDRMLTVEDLYHPDSQLDLGGAMPPSREWLEDGEHFIEGRSGNRIVKVNAVSGDAATLLDPDALQALVERLPGFTADSARSFVRSARIEMAGDQSTFLVDSGNDLYLFQREREQFLRLTSDPADEEEALLSPSGALVAYVKNHELEVSAADGSFNRQLTEDGSAVVLNGKLDWVYQEEVYGRGRYRGFWWSPDSSSLAFLQLNIADVPPFTVVDHRPVHLELETTRYPKSGDPNPKARLGMVSVADGKIVWAQLDRYFRDEPLLVRVDWSPDSSRVLCQVQNREQTWLDLVAVDRDSGEATVLFREESPAWVNVLESPEWLEDGSFLWQSERDGFRHLYHFDAKGGLLGQVTSGEWEVSGLEEVDEAAGWVYFTGKADGAPQQQLYRVRMDGSGRERITRERGFHSVKVSPGARFFIDSWSDATTPPRTSLFETGGALVRELEKTEVKELEQFRLGPVEFLQVPTRDGFEMEAMWIKPPDFSPDRRYPVLISVYGGPQSPTVRDRWGGKSYLWNQLLAQKGYIVFSCDNRSASGKGARYAWPVHRNLGELELRDIEDAVQWLREKPFIDGSRIGIWGWSYGGYFTSFALTHSESFRVGIAGAPVTDWRLYDSIYTERYMGLPQANESGYRKSSVVGAASDLHGRLLLIHGTIDDNVHMQNTIQLVDELEKAGKLFDLMLYPGARHGVRNSKHVYHLRTLMTRFILDNL